MRKLYIAFIGGFVGLLIYAATTGNFGIIPDLPFDLPFGKRVQPTERVLSVPVIYPLMTGPAGFNAAQLRTGLEQADGKVSWERSNDERSWIMRYTMRNELSGGDYAGAVRFTYLSDASQAGVTGPGFLVSGWAENGRDLNAFEITNTLAQIAAGMYQDGQL